MAGSITMTQQLPGTAAILPQARISLLRRSSIPEHHIVAHRFPTSRTQEGALVDDKVFENRVRRIASRQALRLQSNRRRDRLAIDYGFYRLIDGNDQAVTSFAPL